MNDVERFERKFMIDEVAAFRIERELKRYLLQDPHNRPGGYEVRSVYFDTPSERDYRMKLDGLDNRWKIRLRTYGPDAKDALLEIKQKRGMTTRKRSLPVTRDQAEQLLDGRYGFLLDSSNAFVSALGREMEMRVYRARCLARFLRTAYVLSENNTRVTFDREISASEATNNLFSKGLVTYPVMPPGRIVLEVKFSEFLISTVKRALGSDLLPADSVSKYILARVISKHGGIGR